MLREFVKGLNAAARSLDNPLGIAFSGVATAQRSARARSRPTATSRRCWSTTSSTRCPARTQRRERRQKKLQMSALELVQRITRFRPELDVYILIAQEKEDDVVDALFTEAVDGYFYREERDYRGIYRILNAQIQENARTPFYDQLKNYVWMAKDQWHTPGHSSGESLRGSPWVNDFYEFMGEHVFDADLSVSVPMLDSLMEPKGVIARGAGDGGQGLRRAPHLLRHQRHLDRQQGDLPDAARAGREAAARPQLPQERAPRRGALGRAPGLPRLGAQPQVRALRPGAEEDILQRNQQASRRAGADPHLLHLRRPALRPRADRRGGARKGHQGHHRRGLVRLRALPPGVPPHRARGRRRLRHAVARTRCCRRSRRPR